MTADTFPWLSHFTIRESDAMETLRDKLADHQLTQVDVHTRHQLIKGRTYSEVLAYIRRNPRKPREAA